MLWRIVRKVEVRFSGFVRDSYRGWRLLIRDVLRPKVRKYDRWVLSVTGVMSVERVEELGPWRRGLSIFVEYEEDGVVESTEVKPGGDFPVCCDPVWLNDYVGSPVRDWRFEHVRFGAVLGEFGPWLVGGGFVLASFVVSSWLGN